MTNLEELVQKKELPTLLSDSLATMDPAHLTKLLMTAMRESTIPSAEKQEIEEKKSKKDVKTPKRGSLKMDYCQVCECNLNKDGKKAGATAARKHVRKIHIKRNLFSCSVCEYSSCYDKSAVKTHINRNHSSVGDVISTPRDEAQENEWMQKCYGAKEAGTVVGSHEEEDAMETTQEGDEEMPVLETPPSTPSHSPALAEAEKEETDPLTKLEESSDPKSLVFSTPLEEALWQQLQTVSAQNTMLINIIGIQMGQKPF